MEQGEYILIRLLTESDAQEFWSLRFKSLLDSPDAFGALYEEEIKKSVESLISRFKGNFIAPGEENFVLGAFNDQNEMVGVVGFNREVRVKLRHKGFVWGMYVMPEYRKMGIGKALLSELIDKVRSMGTVEQINLGVISSNIGAKELYTSVGFNIYGIEKNAMKAGDKYFDEDLMVLFVK